MSKLIIIVCGIGLVVGILGVGYRFLSGTAAPVAGPDTFAAAATEAPSATSTPLTASTTTPITNTQQSKKIMTATLHTNQGDITIEFYPQNAPNTVANFIKLAQSGFYDGTKFHRVIKDFMNQGGDPLTRDDSKMAAWGTGSPGYKFNDEISAHNSNDAGAVAMANSGPNTQGSQFFINARDNHNLDSGYTVFAHVTAGMDVVTRINQTPTDASDRPLQPVILERVVLN